SITDQRAACGTFVPDRRTASPERDKEPVMTERPDLVIDGDGHVIEVNETYERIDPQYRHRRPRYTQAAAGYIVRLVDGKIWGPDTECDIDGAIAEMHRAVDTLGMLGIQIGCTVREDTLLSDARLEPFWAEADRCNIAIAVHGPALPSLFRSYFDINRPDHMLEASHMAH